jgi:hypothetical protein
MFSLTRLGTVWGDQYGSADEHFMRGKGNSPVFGSQHMG